MYKIERIEKIREILQMYHKADVSTLSRELNVTDATIRSDLDELEKEGFLSRFHGGAVLQEALPSGSSSFRQPDDDLDDNPAKRRVGSVAASLIRDRENIFLGAGTTSCHIANALRERGDISINVLTNNFPATRILQGCPNIKIHFMGGRVEPDGLFTVPDDLPKTLKGFFVDKMFFSIDGIDLNAGYTLSDTAVHDIILSVAALSGQVIMAADSSKFEKRSFMKVGNLTFAPVVVTNADIPLEFVRYYQEHGILVYTDKDVSV